MLITKHSARRFEYAGALAKEQGHTYELPVACPVAGWSALKYACPRRVAA